MKTIENILRGFKKTTPHEADTTTNGKFWQIFDRQEVDGIGDDPSPI
jgi:hypothetical protein